MAAVGTLWWNTPEWVSQGQGLGQPWGYAYTCFNGKKRRKNLSRSCTLFRVIGAYSSRPVWSLVRPTPIDLVGV